MFQSHQKSWMSQTIEQNNNYNNETEGRGGEIDHDVGSNNQSSSYLVLVTFHISAGDPSVRRLSCV